MTEVTQNDIYESANQKRYTTRNPVYRWHMQRFLETLYALLEQSEPGSVLDAGCGEGHVIHYIAERNPELRLSGVDINEEAIAYAKEHFGNEVRFRTGSVYKLPYSDSSFDTVVCSEVLEHLDEPNRAIAQLKRVARNYVLITVPREPYFKWLNNLGRALGISPDPGHVNFWTAKTFQDYINLHFEEATFEFVHTYQLALAKVGS